jgi:DNA-binding response OmpR family regulator
VVEDEAAVRDLVTSRLRAAGHQVVAAESGAAAIEVVSSRGAPDVAVLDVGLPDIDGYTLLESLRQAGTPSTFGAVFLSAAVDDESIDRGRQLGATYLTKPFVASALLAAVEAANAPPGADSW